MKESRVWSHVRPTVIQVPEPLSIFSTGIIGDVGNKVKVSFWEYPLFPEGHTLTRDNPSLNAFFSIDFSKVVAILIRCWHSSFRMMPLPVNGKTGR